jgi:hypothetical protein
METDFAHSCVLPGGDPWEIYQTVWSTGENSVSPSHCAKVLIKYGAPLISVLHNLLRGKIE